MNSPMIVLFTDFGLSGPYVGQMKAVLTRMAPASPIVDLFHDAPAFDAEASAHLLAAYAQSFPPGSVFLCVVDPGVGDTQRRPVMVHIDECWFVGPDNGLFEVVASRANAVEWWEIQWRPEVLSASFHGRDLFAPVAAALAGGDMPTAAIIPPPTRLLTIEDRAAVIYIDHYGNAITGLRAAVLTANTQLKIGDQMLHRARTFSEVEAGVAFCYENANGLMEVAVNRGSAAKTLGLAVGDALQLLPGQ
jgi:S-adenosylmethionine hydrolase